MGTFAIIRRHIVPNLLGLVAVYVTLTIPQVILMESFLSFLGLGVQEPMTSWGALVKDGSDEMPEFALAAALSGGLSRRHAVLLQLPRRRHARRARPEGPVAGLAMNLLEVRNLDVRFSTPDGEVHAVKKLNFDLGAGETLGVVGESGSGKSQTVLSLMGLLADNGRATGTAFFDGHDLLTLSPEALRRIRGRRISMIFQDPMTSLNPYLTIAEQMMQVVRVHDRTTRKVARARCLEMLHAVKIPDAPARLDCYPHELSGGMRQRAMIAASLLLDPPDSRRRRTHHGPGRDRAGADSGTHAGSQPPARDRDRAHHPRPWRHRRVVRTRAGDA